MGLNCIGFYLKKKIKLMDKAVLNFYFIVEEMQCLRRRRSVFLSCPAANPVLPYDLSWESVEGSMVK